jgi:uncharacterized protein (DUF885 family)
MKPWKKYTLGTVAALLTASTVWVVNLLWFKPFSIDLFYDRSFVRFVITNPEFLSSMRVVPPWLEWYEDDFSDDSVAKQLADAATMRETLATLRRYDRATQTPAQLLSTDILDWFLDQQVRGEPYQWHAYPVTQLFGIQNQLPEFMVETHQINSKDDAGDYVARLSKFGIKFDQVLEGMALRESNGIRPPDFVVDKVLVGMRKFVATPARDNVLYTSFVERAAKVAELDAPAREAFAAEVEAEITRTVYPAYGRMIAFLEGIRPRLTHDAGAWRLPDGDAYYAHELRGYTTTDYTPEQVHQLGLDQVARITAEMRAILDGLPEAKDYKGLSVGEAMARLNEDPRFLYPDTPEAREQILKDYQTIIDQVDAGMDQAFAVRPKAKVEVRRVPEFREKDAPGAYYNDAARDGSRPGIFYANLRNVKEVAKFGMRTLAYHEAIPGHHFQISVAQELEGVPQFRTFGLFTAYTEGWALYAEQLAAEHGYLDDPYDRLGHLQAALFRATRLVVDTGMHAKRWSREQAIDYMRSTTGMTETDVVAEVERYIVWPGQACAYMVGKLKILELRGRAQAGLGARYDEKAFHDVVLKNGAVPLAILERLVDAWIAERKAG